MPKDFFQFLFSPRDWRGEVDALLIQAECVYKRDDEGYATSKIVKKALDVCKEVNYAEKTPEVEKWHEEIQKFIKEAAIKRRAYRRKTNPQICY